MAADEQDGGLGVASRHLGDDVARSGAFGFLADQGQVHGDGLAALEDSDQLLGVRNAQRAGGDRGGPVREILHAGVRVAVVIGADRADDDRQGALLGRDRRALPPRRAELAVTRPVLRRHHVMVDEDDLASDSAIGSGAQRIDAVEMDDLAGYSVWSGRTAVAKRGDDEFLREGRDDLGAFGAASPHRHGEGFDMDVRKSHRGQPFDGPVAGPRFSFGGGQALPHLGGQAFDDVPGIMIVLERIVAQRGDLGIDEHRRRQRGG